jgi:hypothetical protein
LFQRQSLLPPTLKSKSMKGLKLQIWTFFAFKNVFLPFLFPTFYWRNIYIYIFKFLRRNVVVLILHIAPYLNIEVGKLASVLGGMFLGNNKVIFYIFLFLKTFHTFFFLYAFYCFSPFCLVYQKKKIFF